MTPNSADSSAMYSAQLLGIAQRSLNAPATAYILPILRFWHRPWGETERTLLIDGIRPGGAGVQSSASPMRIIIGADGFLLRSSLADGREPLGRHIRGHVRRRKQGTAAVVTTRSAPHQPGAVLGRAASHWASPRTSWRRGPGLASRGHPAGWTGAKILPTESPNWPSRGGKGNSAAVESHDGGCLRVSLG